MVSLPLLFAVPAQEGEQIQIMLQFVQQPQHRRGTCRRRQIEAETELEIAAGRGTALQFQQVETQRREFGQHRVKGAGLMRQGQNQADAVEALTALGYSATDALKAVRGVENGAEMTVEQLLRASLKNI